MAPKLYKTDISGPVRSTILTAHILGIELEHVEVNFWKGDHMKPEFCAMNPQHTLPTLVDGDTILWDSHAINVYLITKYGKDDSLYPKDPKIRAMVDQRLHFDSGVLFSLIRYIFRPIIFKGIKVVPQHLLDEIIIAYEFMEKFLEGHKWAVGNTLTLADLHMATSTISLVVFLPINEEKFPNLTAWIDNFKKLPFYHLSAKGAKDFQDAVEKYTS